MLLINIVGLICFLSVQIRSQLTCNIYDFTKETLSCVSSCPSGSTLVDKNKCLRKDQYIVQGNVMPCPSFFTNDDRTICCQKDQYIVDNQCQTCNGNVFQNGIYCCSGSQYMNYVSKTIGCTKIGTGQCSSISLQNKFKVCCPSGQFHHLELNICVPSSNYNCDSGLGVCCNTGKYLEYISSTKKYVCVQNCNWSRTDSFKCSQQFCTPNEGILQSGNSIRDIYNYQESSNSTLLMVFNNQCCYGLSTTGQCFKNYTANQCGKRFTNRGWSVCCAFGLYYNVQQKVCLDTCTGYVILDMICVTNNSYLMLNNASPSESTTAFCNGLAIPPLFPVCCPKGFYLDGLNGCKLCTGTIHKMTYFQVCCSPQQYFDKNLQKCRACQGKVDKTGLLCCFQNQYFSYSQSGVGSCNSYCDNSNIYQTSYCCQSLSNPSCQLSSFKPTVCGSQYFVDGFCQVCPRFCSNIDTCTTGDALKCQKVCQQNTVYFSDLDQCLSCDNSCTGCTAPFDNSACINCAQDYVMVNRVCVRCEISCKTCSGSASNCSSCYEESPRPFFQNGQCLRFCGSGSYDDGNQCQSCNFNCVQCQGNSQSQCLKCSRSSFLASTFSGDCQGCSGVCDQCFRGSSSCITCKNTYKYYPNTKTCTLSCQSNEISLRFSNSTMETCYPCHSMCKTCQLTPQNCYTCKNNSQYLDSSFGVNLCMDCVSPCVFCSSKDNCTSCIDGYYLNVDTQKCIACAKTCKTCHNGSDIGCLSCFGDSQLVGGKCIGCSSSCAKCDINQNCIECNANFFLFSGACVTKCPDGYYGANKKCSLCYSQCLTCSDGTQNGCLTCPDKLQLLNGKCVGCSDNCKSCNVNLSCTECNDGYLLYQQICQTSCPKSTFVSNGTCKNCPSSCTACMSGTSCTQCASGYPILFRNQCLIECPDGYQKVQNSNSCQLKNNTNTNDTDNNNTNGNGTNNNNTNNNTNNTTPTTLTTKIISQTFYYDSSQMIGYINLYFNSTNKDDITALVSNYKFYMVNLGTKIQKQIPVSVVSYDFINKKVTLKAGSFDNINIKDYDAVATISLKPMISVSVSTQHLSSLTELKKISALSTVPSYQRVSSQSYNQLMVGSYKSSPLSNIKIIGIFISLALLIFATLSKLKSHFLAQQANALLLHYINFAQVVYLFKYIKLDENGHFGFLQGFGYSMLSFFPNFFSGLVPSDYVQITNQKSLVPDANLIRNAGFIFSYQLIIIGCLLAGILVSFGWWKKERLQEMPQIRKVVRIGVLWFGVGFLPELFFSFAQLFVPSTVQSQYESFHTGNIAFSYIIVFLVPITMGAIFYDFYATYNSDVLQHYYTLREGAQYVQIYAQSLILALSIDRPLITLILIPLQILWLAFNYMLYRYGEGYHLLDCTKFIVSSGLITLGILTLSLIEKIRWEIVMVLIIISFIINIIYSIYQVVGLYYYYIFKDKPIKDS